jgi:hypothetical protein
MLYDHDQYFILEGDSLRRKINNLEEYFFISKLNIRNYLIVWEACAKLTKVLQYKKYLESKILKIEIFEFWCVNTKRWKLKFEICMWNVWNLEFWKLKCLNWDVWILKVENWNWKLKFLCETSRIWKLEIWNAWIWMCEYYKLKVENKNLKFICEVFGRNLKIWKLKCLNIEI